MGHGPVPADTTAAQWPRATTQAGPRTRRIWPITTSMIYMGTL